MSEKIYVVNVKTKAGTIVTARGDTADELVNNINGLIAVGAEEAIATLEQLLTGVTAVPSVVGGVNTVVAALGGTVVSETAIPAGMQPAAFAPVSPPPLQANPQAGMATKSCIHGVMTKREGDGPYGHYKAFMCPTEKGTPDQCKAIYTKQGSQEYINF